MPSEAGLDHPSTDSGSIPESLIDSFTTVTHSSTPLPVVAMFGLFIQHHIMGTRSRIGIELPDYSVLSVYCHWDGYPEHNGRILMEHYQNRQLIQELIDGGDISSLRSTEDWNGNEHDPQPLYYSERGEDVPPHHSTFDEFVSSSAWEEYAYLYDLNGNWKAYALIREVGTEPEEIDLSKYAVEKAL